MAVLLCYHLAALAVSSHASAKATIAENIERTRQLRTKTLRHGQEAFDPPTQLYRVPLWQEAIDGSAIDGSLLAVHLRAQAEAARVRVEREAAALEWRAWLEPATADLANEFVSFVSEVREAQDYAGNGQFFFEQVSISVEERWGPRQVLKRVAASRALKPSLRERMQSAAAQGLPSPLSATDAPQVWALFYANVRAVLQQKMEEPDGTAKSAGWSRSMHWRLLRRMRSSLQRQGRLRRHL